MTPGSIGSVATFAFTGRDYVATGFSDGDSSWALCDHFCSLSEFSDLRGATLVNANGPAGITLNGQLLAWDSGFGFGVVSYHSSLDPSGVLTLWGMASGSGTIRAYDWRNPCCQVGPTVTVSGIWRYDATYLPDGGYGADGSYPNYRLDNMTIVAVPEPGTPALFLTSFLTLSPLISRRVRSAVGLHRT